MSGPAFLFDSATRYTAPTADGQQFLVLRFEEPDPHLDHIEIVQSVAALLRDKAGVR